MKVRLLMDYIERALNLERLAEEETDPRLKAELEGQAKAYRNLARKRAAQLGLPSPSEPQKLQLGPA
jgi:hypothetical protein